MQSKEKNPYFNNFIKEKKEIAFFLLFLQSKFQSINKKNIAIITLSCSKNVVDSVEVATRLSKHYNIEYDNAENADIVVINTCGFILDSQQESIDTILFYAREKKFGNIEKLFVFGCLSERFKKELKKEIPECDEYFGVNSLEDILKSLECENNIDSDYSRILSTPQHTAYIKVSEGCNRRCSFCIIPYIRGKYVSKKIEEIVSEVKFLAQNGTKEFNLIAQDLSYYGKDIYDKFALKDLLEEITKIEGVHWVRLHYTYPNNFPMETLELMKNNPKICHYLDIPIQHISDKILTKMKRGHTKEETISLIKKFRQEIPDIALRTSLLVGFPSENDKDFQELKEFVKEAKFDRLGVFQYSEEKGTFSAEYYKDNLSKKKKQQRADEIMAIQQQISLELNTQKIGKTFEVLLDRQENGYFIGRTQYDSPEVDCEVLIEENSAPNLQIGNFYQVKITAAEEFDLFGQVEK